MLITRWLIRILQDFPHTFVLRETKNGSVRFAISTRQSIVRAISYRHSRHSVHSCLCKCHYSNLQRERNELHASRRGNIRFVFCCHCGNFSAFCSMGMKDIASLVRSNMCRHDWCWIAEILVDDLRFLTIEYVKMSWNTNSIAKTWLWSCFRHCQSVHTADDYEMLKPYTKTKMQRKHCSVLHRCQINENLDLFFIIFIQKATNSRL